ncbi:hypothetical protein [Streptomyces sp. VB1]|nr:hypothetical protein [Streptomyces sp. VB1]UZI28053.1 hypothetical protein OH133_07865 [Streptomyces sp. VB1]
MSICQGGMRYVEEAVVAMLPQLLDAPAHRGLDPVIKGGPGEPVRRE